MLWMRTVFRIARLGKALGVVRYLIKPTYKAPTRMGPGHCYHVPAPSRQATTSTLHFGHFHVTPTGLSIHEIRSFHYVH